MGWYLPMYCPLLYEELRRRLRGVWGHLVLLIYGLALVLMLIGAAMVKDISQTNPREWPEFGRALWQIFLVGQLLVVILISPGLTAGTISAERERKTLELLFLTPMSTLSMVVGKYLGAIGQMLIVVLSGMPIIAIVFLYGGVSPKEVLLGYLMMLVSGIFFSSLGFLASCLSARVTSAVAWAYGFMLLVLIGLPIGLGLLSLTNFIDFDAWLWVLAPNPFLMYFSTADADLSVWQPLIVTMVEVIAILVGSALLVRRLRGVSHFLPRRVSLELARYNSHAPKMGATMEEKMAPPVTEAAEAE